MITHIRGCPIGDHYDSNWDCPNYCDEECKTAQCLCELLQEVEHRGYIAGVQAASKIVNSWVDNLSLNYDDLMNSIDALLEDR